MSFRSSPCRTSSLHDFLNLVFLNQFFITNWQTIDSKQLFKYHSNTRLVQISHKITYIFSSINNMLKICTDTVYSPNTYPRQHLYTHPSIQLQNAVRSPRIHHTHTARPPSTFSWMNPASRDAISSSRTYAGRALSRPQLTHSGGELPHDKVDIREGGGRRGSPRWI